MDDVTVALAGNPNTGKSTIFNALTGSKQHVGNWPGKTVERRQGTWICDGMEVDVIDLPGTYSLSAYSPEELIARDYLVDHRPNAVVVVLDASNLERNLYLAVQILEMRGDVVIALNMTDTADKRGVEIDIAALAAALGAPVVPTVARQGRGLVELEAAVAAMLREQAGAGTAPGHGQ